MRLELDEWHWLNMVPREFWGAEPPYSRRPLPHPITWVRFTYEDVREQHKDILEALRLTQRKHMKIGYYSDIAQNFFVDQDGTVYEGRGWNAEADRPFCYYNLDGKCLDICLIGFYRREDVHPPWVQLRSAMSLVMYGIKQKYFSPQYRTIGFRDDYVPPYEG